jgi:hypothetical protein
MTFKPPNGLFRDTRNSECSTFFRGITKTVSTLFSLIFRNGIFTATLIETCPSTYLCLLLLQAAVSICYNGHTKMPTHTSGSEWKRMKVGPILRMVDGGKSLYSKYKIHCMCRLRYSYKQDEESLWCKDTCLPTNLLIYVIRGWHFRTISDVTIAKQTIPEYCTNPIPGGYRAGK